MTTSRVRNHELEDLSLAALRFALPSKWVIHEFRKDYGIDVQLEIFDDDGRATGLRCYGQLKSTDKSGHDDVLSLDRDHFEYWAAHSDPVLLLRYYADSQKFSWCWLHEVAWSIKSAAQTLSVVKFLKRWDDVDTPENIKIFLLQRSNALAQRLCPPFFVAITGDVSSIAKIAIFVSKVQPSISTKIFSFLAGDIATASFEIKLTKDGLISSHLGLPGFSVNNLKNESEEEFSALILLLVFLTACKFDRILAARPLAKRCFEIFLNSVSDALLFPLIDSLVYAIGLEETYKLIETVDLSKSEKLNSALISGIAYVASQRYGESAQWISLNRIAYEKEKSTELRGILAYNLGNALSNFGEWGEALSMYRQARIDHPVYINRDYFQQELAGALFENSLFIEAAEHYRVILKLTPSARCYYLLGDALFCAGEFSSAYKEITTSLSMGLAPSSQSHAILLRELCVEMIEGWNINRLIPLEADNGGIALLEKLTETELQNLPASFRPLMHQYGANGLFNFNAGYVAISNGQARLAAYRYLHCAMRQRGDSEAWALAISCCISAGDEDLLTLSIIAGYFYVRESLLNSFYTCCQPSGLGGSKLEEWRRSFGDMVHKTLIADNEKSVTIRLHGSGSSRIINASL